MKASKIFAITIVVLTLLLTACSQTPTTATTTPTPTATPTSTTPTATPTSTTPTATPAATPTPTATPTLKFGEYDLVEDGMPQWLVDTINNGEVGSPELPTENRLVQIMMSAPEGLSETFSFAAYDRFNELHEEFVKYASEERTLYVDNLIVDVDAKPITIDLPESSSEIEFKLVMEIADLMKTEGTVNIWTHEWHNLVIGARNAEFVIVPGKYDDNYIQSLFLDGEFVSIVPEKYGSTAAIESSNSGEYAFYEGIPRSAIYCNKEEEKFSFIQYDCQVYTWQWSAGAYDYFLNPTGYFPLIGNQQVVRLGNSSEYAILHETEVKVVRNYCSYDSAVFGLQDWLSVSFGARCQPFEYEDWDTWTSAIFVADSEQEILWRLTENGLSAIRMDNIIKTGKSVYSETKTSVIGIAYEYDGRWKGHHPLAPEMEDVLTWNEYLSEFHKDQEVTIIDSNNLTFEKKGVRIEIFE